MTTREARWVPFDQALLASNAVLGANGVCNRIRASDDPLDDNYTVKEIPYGPSGRTMRFERCNRPVAWVRIVPGRTRANDTVAYNTFPYCDHHRRRSERNRQAEARREAQNRQGRLKRAYEEATP